MSYQKFYTNPIQSSSLLCQLASMWKNDIMCDAVIKTGNVNTKVSIKLLAIASIGVRNLHVSASKLFVQMFGGRKYFTVRVQFSHKSE